MRFTVFIAALILTSSLSACVSSEPIVMPNGKQGVLVSCPGMANSMADCWKEAGKVCPHGYDVANSTSEGIPVASVTPTYGMAGSIMHRSLMVNCRA